MLSSLIRISAGRRIFAPHRSFSQLVTSFFGAMYLGILRMLFVAWSFSNSTFAIWSTRLYKNSTFLTRLIYSSWHFLEIAFTILCLLTLINLKLPFLYFYLFSSMQLSGFKSWQKSRWWAHLQPVGGFKWTFDYLCYRTSGRPIWTIGGFKWTRTIDLTLIRRVL